MSKSNERLLLEKEVDRAIRELNFHEIGSERYVKTLDHIVTLHKMLAEEKPTPVSRDTLVVVGANLLGVVMLIKNEFVSLIPSKAMSFLFKTRV